MKPLPNNDSFDESIFVEGQEYIVGTNDARLFKDVSFLGTKYYEGKAIMVFQTNTGQQLTINPSYHSFTLESPETLLFPVNDDKTHEENENGKNNTD